MKGLTIMAPGTLESTIAGTWYPGTEKGIRTMAEMWERIDSRDDSVTDFILLLQQCLLFTASEG